MKDKKTIILITDENNRNTSAAIKERVKGSREAQVIIISKQEIDGFWKNFTINYFFKKDTALKKFVTQKSLQFKERKMDKLPSQKTSFDGKKAVHNRMYNIFIRYNPDVVVPLTASVFPAALAARTKARKDIKIAAVLDGYVVDKQMVYVAADKYIVDNDDMKNDLLNLGISTEKIAVAPVPVRKHFLKEVTREEALKSFDLQERPTVLLVASRYGDEKFKKLLTDIEEAHFDINVIVACGYNRKLLSFVREKTAFTGYNEGIDMNAAYSAADLVVTRPVSAVLSEALFKKKLIFSVLPEGEIERRTHEYLGADVLVKVSDGDDLIKKLSSFLGSPEEFSEIKRLAEHSVEGDSAEIICRELLNL